MKILHYSLGFPPYRTGGLTKFCMDLMKQQKSEGNEVGLLWPGKMTFTEKETRIKDNGYTDGIRNYEIINPLPISYDEGICDVEQFIKPGKMEEYVKFLDESNPDVIHIHTLMGLHKSFLGVAKKKNIRIVFTAHDYFPICPKVTMFREGGVCNTVTTCEKCMSCNSNALQIWKIKLLQSHLYKLMKNFPFIKMLRKGHRDAYLSDNYRIDKSEKCIEEPEKYLKLRNYYSSLLNYVDIVHYNSKLTKWVYERYSGNYNSTIISITHADITDQRQIKKFSADKLRFTYLGPLGVEKGFFVLKKALDQLWELQKNFCLNVFFKTTEGSPYLMTHDRYNYEDLKQILNETDVLIAPSIWYETFGFTVLEALSYGVPVIISDNVGAKDIVPENGGIIISNISPEKLYEQIKELDARKLSVMNKNILQNGYIKTMECMSQEIMERCYKVYS